jgi:hypothetical protein
LESWLFLIIRQMASLGICTPKYDHFSKKEADKQASHAVTAR